jgi:acyl-CoA synthetase (AMP-forming)/AMP-acid ligase II/3-hydroxymyristoyl/3-hydroxydecanoyl-(acyl carrier protein) dehydratase
MAEFSAEFSELRAALASCWPLPEYGDAPVAWRGGEAIGETRFLRDIALERDALQRLDTPEITLFEPDAYRFAVQLLAAWSLERTVVLASDGRIDNAKAPGVPTKKSPSAKTARTTVFFTSGSSGRPCRVEKTCAQLWREVEALQQAFGGLLSPGQTRFVRSVPHQHMYGLPVAVLWPLTFAYPIVAERVRHPEELWRLPVADYAFISAPTFLKYLLPDDSGVRINAPRWRLLTSAGSPLPAETRKLWAERLQAPAFEIYGSTETGVVARRANDDPSWQAFPGVRLEVDAASSRLRIHSPLLSPEDAATGFLSNDLARLDDNGLTLLGRADRVLKIGEKRVSLAEVETALAALPTIERAAALPLREGERDVLGAVVVLNEEGERQRKTLGKARFDRHLRDELRADLDPLATPRRWRYVAALPTNDMGKTTQHELTRLFAPEWPRAEFLAQQEEADGRVTALLGLTLPPDLVWFDGHFPELPVLPGVVQIDWAAHFGRLHFGVTAPVTKMRGLKFQRLLHPGDTLRLRLHWRAERQELEFVYHLADATPCSRGILVMRAVEAS